VIVIPTIPLRDGACVLLERGDAGRERIRLSDPLKVARHWDQAGFRRLHIVDMDGAMGIGSNDRVIEDILAATRVEIQVGGGVRTEDRIERLIASGAVRVVIGTRALEDTDWLEEIVNRFPNEVIVAADVRGRRLVSRGWLHTVRADIIDTVEDLNALPLAGLIVTAVDRQGMLGGADLRLMEDIVEASTIPAFAAGGISALDELRALADRGVAGAIVGMALYTGAIDAGAAAWEFGE
jgi:phosphoribosylformimino-5-aminoimidazole carboxamide ribotide isomerase